MVFYFEDDIMSKVTRCVAQNTRPTTIHLGRIYLISQRKSVSSHRLPPTSVSIHLSGQVYFFSIVCDLTLKKSIWVNSACEASLTLVKFPFLFIKELV